MIRNQHGAYAFVFPQGWTLDRSQKDFRMVGPDKVDLCGWPLPQPTPKQSLELETYVLVQSFVLLCGANFHWGKLLMCRGKMGGPGVVLDMPAQTKEAPRKILAFMAKSGRQFRPFYFLIPTERGKDKSQRYLAILRTLKFPALENCAMK
ncbi:MAG: hypothetical protein DMG62_22115 [Acidobacteria bacterium]|nr:MAG: hypothetical protein DMG62_22115 [Acidobacteriota bacterium]